MIQLKSPRKGGCYAGRFQMILFGRGSLRGISGSALFRFSQAVFLCLLISVNSLGALDHDDYWDYLKVVSPADIAEFDHDSEMPDSRRLAVYSAAALSSDPPPRWINDARRILEERLHQGYEQDILYYLVRAQIARRIHNRVESYAISSTALASVDMDERFKKAFKRVAAGVLYDMILNYQFRVMQRNEEKLVYHPAEGLFLSTGVLNSVDGTVVLTDADCVAWVVHLDRLEIPRQIPAADLHARLRASGIAVPDPPVTDVDLVGLAWRQYLGLAKPAVFDRAAGDREHLDDNGSDNQISSTVPRRWDLVLDVLGALSSWDKHRGLIDALSSHADSQLRFNEDYIIQQIVDGLGIEADPMVAVASAYYCLMHNRHAVGTHEMRGNEAIRWLETVQQGDRDIVNKRVPGLIDALYAIAYGLLNDNAGKSNYQQRAISMDAEGGWGAFIDERIIVWTTIQD